MKEHDVDSLYELIFETSFLIRYGYYDTKMKKVESNYIEDDDLENYYGTPDAFYLKIFNMLDVSKLLEKEDIRNLFNLNKINLNNTTEPISFNIPKSNYTRREYKMPNIYSYLQLCYYLSERKNDFIEIFKSNKQSTSKYFNQLDFDFKFTKKLETKNLFTGTKILSIDLSNFYHTLYTHSIPWVINGKQNSKAEQHKGFANKLDKLIQQCQYGETHGVPTGSLVTRIIAELYMCYIDKEMEDKGFKYSRYVDDIKFPYANESEKDRFLREFSRICREYNLIINDKKTEIHEFPFRNNMEKMDIFSFFEGYTNKTTIKKWREKISDFIFFCLSEEANGNKGAMKCIFSVINNTLKYQNLSVDKIEKIFTLKDEVSGFNLYEVLLDTSLKDSRLTNRFISFTENLMELGLKKKPINKIVRLYFMDNKYVYRKKLLDCTMNKWNQEVYQLLLYSVVFECYDIFTQKNIREVLESSLDDYSACLCVILWIKKKMNIDLLLGILDDSLSRIHGTYPKDNSRMLEKFWLLRYFVFSLISEDIISQEAVNAYYLKNGHLKSSNGIAISELNSEYAITTNIFRSRPLPVV